MSIQSKYLELVTDDNEQLLGHTKEEASQSPGKVD